MSVSEACSPRRPAHRRRGAPFSRLVVGVLRRLHGGNGRQNMCLLLSIEEEMSDKKASMFGHRGSAMLGGLL